MNDSIPIYWIFILVLFVFIFYLKFVHKITKFRKLSNVSDASLKVRYTVTLNLVVVMVSAVLFVIN